MKDMSGMRFMNVNKEYECDELYRKWKKRIM